MYEHKEEAHLKIIDAEYTIEEELDGVEDLNDLLQAGEEETIYRTEEEDVPPVSVLPEVQRPQIFHFKNTATIAVYPVGDGLVNMGFAVVDPADVQKSRVSKRRGRSIAGGRSMTIRGPKYVNRVLRLPKAIEKVERQFADNLIQACFLLMDSDLANVVPFLIQRTIDRFWSEQGWPVPLAPVASRKIPVELPHIMF